MREIKISIANDSKTGAFNFAWVELSKLPNVGYMKILCKMKGIIKYSLN